MENINNSDLILFSETQKFKQWWIWLLLLSINSIFIFGIYVQVICGEKFGDKQGSNAMLIATTAFTFLITALFAIVHLDTIIKRDGIYFRFYPVQRKYKYLSWQKITKSYVRRYKPILEYGGWGMRIGLFGRGRAYNISGRNGLQLVYSDGKKLLIGTQKPEEITEILVSLKQYIE